ncbi:hypothetical protein [Roseovarius confluentis]|uniref:hypothetical protein n=1 Tax=Roseovarius confluentis TaxID=1852027 RepID=UPI000CDDC1B5|nr:hypothetical protein [Roseovarius confluentis]
MSIKARLGKLEKHSGDTGLSTVIFRTVYEDRNGEAESEKAEGYIAWGQNRVARVERGEQESHEDFNARLDGYKNLSWPQAQRTEGLRIAHANEAVTNSRKAEQ